MSGAATRGLNVWHLVVGLGRGGVEKLLVTLLPRMADHGVHPRVVALKQWDSMGDELQAAGVPVAVLDGAGRADPRPIWRLLAMLRSERPDLIHAHLSRAVLAAGWTGRLTGTPYVAHFHSLVDERRAWQDRLEARACKSARARVAVSQAVADDRATRLGLPADAFRVVPNAVDPQGLQNVPAPVPGRPLVAGFLGRLLERTKGIDVLLAAAGRLSAMAAGVVVEIAGGPEAAARRVAARVAEAGLSGTVRVLGEVPGAAAVLERWDVLVLPSRQEGFGLVLLEAMATGRPVVATRQGGIPEVVEHGRSGLLVPAGDPDALAEALARLARDPDEVVRLGRAARGVVAERFEPGRIAARWAAIARQAARGEEAA